MTLSIAPTKKILSAIPQNRNAISPQLLAIKKDGVAGYSEPEKRIESAKGDTSDINVLY